MLDYIKNLFKSKPTEERSSTVTGLPWLQFTDSGKTTRVNEQNLLTISAINTCVERIAWDIASMPWEVMKDRLEQPEHPVYGLLKFDANDWMSNSAWREAMVANVLLWGNSYSWIEYANGRPIALHLLPSDRTTVHKHNGRLWYVARDDEYNETVLTPDQVFHVKGLSLSGYEGLSVIERHALSLGVALSSKKYATKAFDDGAAIRGYFSHPSRLTKEAEQNLRKIIDSVKGWQNSGKLPLFQEGIEFHPVNLAMPPEQAQWVAAQGYTDAQIASIFHLDEVWLNNKARSTWANYSEAMLNYIHRSLHWWIIQLETEANRKLFHTNERGVYYSKINVRSMSRSKPEDQTDLLVKELSYGLITPNEYFDLMDRPRIGTEGDKRYYPANLIEQNEEPQPQPEQTPQRSIDIEPLLQDCVERILTKEQNAIGRIDKKQERESQEWIDAMDAFYANHKDWVAKVLAPSLASVGLKEKAKTLGAAWCERSLDLLAEQKSISEDRYLQVRSMINDT